MAWVRIDDNVPHHRKHLKAGPDACWLWVCCIAYAQRQLTDGIIPREAVPMLGLKSPRKLIDKLVAVGLLDTHELGWRVHDYLEHNDCRDVALSKRADVSAQRAEAGRKSGEARRRNAANKGTTDERPRSTDVQRDNEHLLNPIPSHPSTPVPKEQERAAPGVRFAPLVSNEHRKHAHCGRVCLHASLFSSFVRRRNHPQADQEIREWAMDVEREWAAGGPKAAVETGDEYDFWRARYAERWPTPVDASSSPAPRGRHVPDADATRRMLGL